jgi:hypothetical protein
VPTLVNKRSAAQLATGQAVRPAVRCTVLNRMEYMTATYTICSSDSELCVARPPKEVFGHTHYFLFQDRHTDKDALCLFI